jgi:hypothetical protein
MYSLEEDEGGPAYPSDWTEEQPTGVDWLMIGLLIVALIAVLGLIPLWRTVYQRYAGPRPDSVPGSYFHLESERFLAVREIERLGDQGTGEVGIDDSEPARFHSIAVRFSAAPMPSTRYAVALGQGKRSPDLGVQLTGFDSKVV